MSRPAHSPGHAARHAVAAALAAELGHDLQGAINLFRMAKERLERGQALDSEDVSLLGEELERLGQISGRLRDLARPRSPLERQSLTPRALLALALADTSQSPLDLELELEHACTVSADPRVLAQALRELIDNAWEAKQTRAGVRFYDGTQADERAGFCVWDDGPGFSMPSAQAPAWGVTSKTDAAGLGLTLALRGARAHGFRLDLRRQGEVTEAWLLIPARELQTSATKGER